MRAIGKTTDKMARARNGTKMDQSTRETLLMGLSKDEEK